MTMTHYEARFIEFYCFSPTTNFYKGGESIEVSGWVETLITEQDIHFKVECVYIGGG